MRTSDCIRTRVGAFADRTFDMARRCVRRSQRFTASLLQTSLFLLLPIASGLAQPGPSVVFTKIPAANPGGPQTMGAIEGRVKNARRELKLVLYAKSGRWYIQPFADHPFTTISDSKWQSPTHLGTDYAALLVEPDYVPAVSVEALPKAGAGVVALVVTEGTPPFWRTWWFRLLLVLFAFLIILGAYRWRIKHLAHQLNLRFEERLSERTRIAQELHDTLLQGFLSVSMQLHVVNDQLPESSPTKNQLDHVLKLMGRVVEEGRNAVRGLRPPEDSPYNLQEAFSHLQQELAGQPPLDFHIIVEGSQRSLHPVIRDEVYRIGREAVVNAFRHSEASSVEVELEYGAHQLRLLVRDNGRGIDAHVLRSGREGHFGLSGMHERAIKIGAKFKVWSRDKEGTEVELSVPGQAAYRSYSAVNRWEWLPGMRPRRAGQGVLTPPRDHERSEIEP